MLLQYFLVAVILIVTDCISCVNEYHLNVEQILTNGFSVTSEQTPTHPPRLEPELIVGRGKAVPSPPASGLAGMRLDTL